MMQRGALPPHRAWVEVNLDAVDKNIPRIQALLPAGVKLMAVLKANAYSCGAVAIAKALQHHAVDWFAVANLDEALELRHAGIDKPILILGYTPPSQSTLLHAHRHTQTAVSYTHGMALAAACEAADCSVDIHRKLDTGMNRLGLAACGDGFTAAIDEAAALLSHSRLHVTGIFTHFACLYELDTDAVAFLKLRYERFITFTEALQVYCHLTRRLPHVYHRDGQPITKNSLFLSQPEHPAERSEQ